MDVVAQLVIVEMAVQNLQFQQRTYFTIPNLETKIRQPTNLINHMHSQRYKFTNSKI